MAEFFPLVQLVSDCTLDAEILFDFNDHATWPAHDGFSIGAPKYLGEVDAIAPRLGYPDVKFDYTLKSDPVTVQSIISDLIRLLGRRHGWLKVQRSEASTPGFLRIFRASPDEFSFEQVLGDGTEGTDEWHVALTIPREPGIRSARVIWAPITVTNNPASGGCVATLPDVLGDLPVPLTVTLGPDNGLLSPMLSVCASETTPPFIVVECESTPEFEGDAALGGAGVLTTNGSISLQFTPPAPGTWGAWVRCSSSAAFSMLLQQSGAVLPATTVVPNGSGFVYVYVGKLVAPLGLGPRSPQAVSGNASFGLSVAGTTQVNLDKVVLVPLETPTSPAPANVGVFRAIGQLGGYGYIDAVERDAYSLDSNGHAPVNTYPGQVAGGWPVAHPGMVNRLAVLRCAAMGDLEADQYDSTSDTTTITISYSPESLFLPDETPELPVD